MIKFKLYSGNKSDINLVGASRIKLDTNLNNFSRRTNLVKEYLKNDSRTELNKLNRGGMDFYKDIDKE